MKILFKITGILLMLSVCGCRNQAPHTSNLDWSEAADPQQKELAAWNGVSGTHASFGSVDVHYSRSAPYVDSVALKAVVSGWRGEKLSTQIVVWSADSLRSLRCRVGDFVSPKGEKLKDIGRARFVKYVLSDRFDPEKPCGARPDGKYPTFLAPDLLDPAEVLDVEQKSLRPVWISVDIPQDAPAGSYRSEVTLQAEGGFKTLLELDLEVIDRQLPPASEWSYHLDLWQHPSAVASLEGVEMWSDEHFRLMEPTMRLLAQAGQKVITTNMNKDPWNCQTHFPYEDMICWTRLGDGSWEYDFTVFDRWVSFMMGLGIDRFINCYSLLPWNNELHYKDDVSGEMITVVAEPSGELFRAIWTPFLKSFTEHLREKGWLPITNIAMDERSDTDMDLAITLLGEVAPELGISMADDKFLFRKYPHIKDMCVGIFANLTVEEIVARRNSGKVSTYYVCCSSGFPNTYTSSEPLEAVYLSWFAMARDYDGFLRWAYNAWPENPIRDSRFCKWTAGDTYMVYPGGRSSIRFERFVEGIQDWEKIRLLKQQFTADSSAAAKEKLARLEAAVAQFHAGIPFEGWQGELNRAKQLVNELSR